MIIKRHFAPRRAGWRGGDLHIQLRMGYGRASRVRRGDDLGTAGFGRLRVVSSHDVRSRSLSNLGRVVHCWVARLGRGRAGQESVSRSESADPIPSRAWSGQRGDQ